MDQSQILKIFNETDNMAQKYSLFCDMDSVICDLPKQFKKYSGEDINGYEDKHGKAAFWHFPDTVGEAFWSEMDWMPDGQQLWNYVSKYNPTILSAPSKHPTSSTGKVKWLQKHITLPNYEVQTKAKHGWDGKSKIILNPDKFRYVRNQYDLLIDDTDKKINDWRKAGGTGILHKNTNDTIKQLKELGL